MTPSLAYAGLLRAVCRFCERYAGVSREQFWANLKADPGSLLEAVNWHLGAAPDPIEDYGTQLTHDEWAFIKCASNADRFYADLKPYLLTILGNGELVDQLLDYQKTLLADVYQLGEVTFLGVNWNFHEYVTEDADLVNEKTVYMVERVAFLGDFVKYARLVKAGVHPENRLQTRQAGWAPFFPRGKGPLVSVMMPTRGRPAHLLQAVDSLWSLAIDKQIEFVFRADDDDHETIEVLQKIAEMVPSKVLVGPRGRGYHAMHEWVNQMAAECEGDWLLLANDDCRVTTPGWDLVVELAGTSKPWPGIFDVAMFMCRTAGRPAANEFLLCRRKTFEILGHFSLSPHNDTWLHSVCHPILGVCLYLPITFEHYSDTINDKTREESEAAYKTTIHSLTSFAGKRGRIKDMITLLDYMEGCNGPSLSDA